jgi:hypothetical protein
MSLALGDLGFAFFKGRYLNGVATFNVSFQDGVLRLSPDLILAKGKPVPAIFLDKLRQRNFAENLDKNPRASIPLRHVQSIQVKDGKLIIVPKAQP